MSLFDRFRGVRKIELERKEPTLGIAVRQASQQIRVGEGWDGAKVDNLVSGWLTTSVPINQQIERDLRSLRARSRQLSKNDPYVRRFLQLARTNTIGSTGFAFRSKVKRANGKPDQPARDAITAAWTKALRPGAICSKGRYSGLDFYNLASDLVAREGEVIILEERGGEFGVTFRFVDPELLDVNHRTIGRNGNPVRMGIETNKAGRVEAYHFHSTDSTHKHYYQQDGRGYLRIPAQFVIHAFATEYVDQLRGFPHTAAAMLRLRMLNGYEEAELVGARGGAATMGFITRGENGGGFEGEGTVVNDSPDSAEANLIAGGAADQAETITAEAGTFHYIENGADVKMYDPNHPNSAYGAFIKAVLRGIASGLGISYHALANDLEGVNYSSIRAGVLEDREAWKARQEWFIQHIVTPMFERWLAAALLKGAIMLERGKKLSPANLDRYVEHHFQGRRWPWVDPQKDGAANKTAIDERLRSRSDIIRETGADPAEVFEEIQAENELLEELGIKPVAASPAAAPGEEPGAGEDNPDEENEDEET